jgi:hypothetical protein
MSVQRRWNLCCEMLTQQKFAKSVSVSASASVSVSIYVSMYMFVLLSMTVSFSYAAMKNDVSCDN